MLDEYSDKSLLWCGDSALVLRGEARAELAALVWQAAPLVELEPGRAARRLGRDGVFAAAAPMLH
ncbi:hypothetical protein GO986_01345 [Deinococcus sp. HMF7620]|uniref:Uncharacterized protein n=1 Tax=Deinococcus arboris TaxID=2682977 RepID=A0A7C9HVP1_9DEIO|nr:hypothetical protein [Deinococcus arboris]MVN85410.1 hypothetical protein [Deinococcus arboris]